MTARKLKNEKHTKNNEQLKTLNERLEGSLTKSDMLVSGGAGTVIAAGAYFLAPHVMMLPAAVGAAVQVLLAKKLVQNASSWDLLFNKQLLQDQVNNSTDLGDNEDLSAHDHGESLTVPGPTKKIVKPKRLDSEPQTGPITHHFRNGKAVRGGKQLWNAVKQKHNNMKP